MGRRRDLRQRGTRPPDPSKTTDLVAAARAAKGNTTARAAKGNMAAWPDLGGASSVLSPGAHLCSPSPFRKCAYGQQCVVYGCVNTSVCPDCAFIHRGKHLCLDGAHRPPANSS